MRTEGAVLLESTVVVLLSGKQQLRQTLAAQDIEDKPCEDQRGDDGGYVENAAEALPSCSLGIKKYLSIGHCRLTLYSTNRMEADPLSQSMQTVTAVERQIRTVMSILPALLAGALLRVWMLKHFFEVTGDSLIYGGIAKNLLLSGRYALTVGTGETYPTLIRLPGYPLFLAGCFKVFGMENYAAAAWVQIAWSLAGCLLLADLGAADRAGEAEARSWPIAHCGWRRFVRSRRCMRRIR